MEEKRKQFLTAAVAVSMLFFCVLAIVVGASFATAGKQIATYNAETAKFAEERMAVLKAEQDVINAELAEQERLRRKSIASAIDASDAAAGLRNKISEQSVKEGQSTLTKPSSAEDGYEVYQDPEIRVKITAPGGNPDEIYTALDEDAFKIFLSGVRERALVGALARTGSPLAGLKYPAEIALKRRTLCHLIATKDIFSGITIHVSAVGTVNFAEFTSPSHKLSPHIAVRILAMNEVTKKPVNIPVDAVSIPLTKASITQSEIPARFAFDRSVATIKSVQASRSKVLAKGDVLQLFISDATAVAVDQLAVHVEFGDYGTATITGPGEHEPPVTMLVKDTEMFFLAM